MWHNYYKDDGVREICHAVKECDWYAIQIMAEYFINLGVVSHESIIVPAPQHEGYAIYTKQIADIVARVTQAKVCDILRCQPHEMLYKQKLKGKVVVPEFYVTDSITEDKDIWFLDNVIATGATFYGANKLFGGKMKPLVYAIV